MRVHSNFLKQPIKYIDYTNGVARFLLIDDPVLYEFDIESGLITGGMFLSSEEYLKGGYGGFIEFDRALYFIPCRTDSLLKVDLISGEQSLFKIPECRRTFGTRGFTFSFGIKWENEIFLFCHGYGGILVFNLLTESFTLIDQWIDRKLSYHKVEGCFSSNYYQEGSDVFIPFMNTNAVMKFNLQSKQWEISVIAEENQRFVSIEKLKGVFYLTPRDGVAGGLVRWNPQTDRTDTYYNFPKEFSHSAYAFFHSMVIGDKVVMLANRANMSVSFNTRSMSMEEFTRFHAYNSNNNKASYTTKVKKSDKYYLTCNGNLLVWDLKKDSVVCHPLFLSDEIYKEKRERDARRELYLSFNSRGNGNSIVEGDKYTLGDFLCYIRRSQ